jgi:hypothetical protein
MRTACLVLAYAAPRVLAAAVEIYRGIGWDVFVHLDCKADTARYRAEMGKAADLVYFIDEPLSVFWGGFSMVLAEFKLIDAALRSAQYDFLLYVSDDTFPIRPPEALAAMPDPACERITMRRVLPGSGFAWRYEGLYHYDHPATNPRGGGPGRPIDDALVEAITEAQAVGRMGKKHLDIYWGFAYWLLTRPTIEAVLDICRGDPVLWHSFKYSSQPDEIMIHSVIANYLPDRKTMEGPVYMDFSKPNGPAVYHRLADLPADLPTHFYFARKFVPAAVLAPEGTQPA